tara:strand:+ start:1992 stop:3440 length:1449 start_codon:yes stop_codon:yes gene_type:complete
MSLLQNSNAISEGGGYNLENSLRFRRSAFASLTRTPATVGNRQVFTISSWVKRGELGTLQRIFQAGAVYDINNYIELSFSADFLYWSFGATGSTTSALYRDPSAWYHIVLAVDTTQATASNRTKLYVNNELIASFSTENYVPQNTLLSWNNTVPHRIGIPLAGTNSFDGYLTEINAIDGQALTPSDFGETNATTGVWQPAEYTGSYGTNGFYLPMNQTVETYSADYLIVAGGGGGGCDNGGGGGAGGLVSGTTTIVPTTVYTASVGGGGAGRVGNGAKGTNGTNSTFTGLTTAVGGGGAGSNGSTGGSSGGSGGGGALNSGSSGAGTSGQGNAGGAANGGYGGGGGGGAGAAGSVGSGSSNAGNGGIGSTSSITGTSTYYAGGGGGGANGGTAGAGGNGGGGAGAVKGSPDTAVAGTANTGGGGGGGGGANASGPGKSGGSGVVILRVPTAKYTGTVTGSPTVTTDGSDTVIKFTANGSYTA